MPYPVAAVRNKIVGRKIGIPTVPTWDFDPSQVVFTPKMAKRVAPGPFASAPIMQGKFDGSGVSDSLTYPRGAQISGDFYANVDAKQGSVVCWWIPEFNSADLSDGNDRYVFFVDSGCCAKYEVDNGRFRFYIGGDVVQLVVAVTAGTLYSLVFRWDENNKLDGTNYACFSINDSHTFGATSPVPWTPDVTSQISYAISPGNAIIEGFTIYRRPLYDGAYGTDAGNGNEIEKIYNSGAGKKPEEVTGGSDICFQLPTDGVVGELVTGTGEAYSYPWTSNKLLNWHLQDETAGVADNWTVVNGAVLADAETANILFDTRSQKISVDAADEGMKQAFAVVAGEDYHVDPWVMAGGVGQGARLRIYDATNLADVVSVETESTIYAQLETAFEVPIGCTSIEVYIESVDAATYDIYCGQVQLHENNVDNGGMEGTYDDESGGGAGTIDVAPGWNKWGVETDGTDELSKDTAIFHSGLSSQKVDVTSTNEGILTAANVFTVGSWYAVTVWLYAISGSVRLYDPFGFLSETVTPGSAWSKYVFVVKATSNRPLVISASGGAADFRVDDVSIVELDDVSITATAANEANSTEDGGIRVDGLDGCSVDITGELGATSGKVRFDWTPRHGDGDFEKFGSSNPRVITLYNNNNNNIVLRSDNNDAIILYINVGGGGTQNNFWTALGVTAGITYLVEIEYNATQVTASFDGTVRITVVYPGGIDFGANIPDTAYIGHNETNTEHFDAVFSAPD